VDIETTGGSHFSSRVLEVAVVRVEQNRVVRTYQTLLHPDEPIPPFITQLTGIRDDDVAGSPRFEDVADDLAEVLDGAIFVAHNVRFDYSFLKMEFERLGAQFRPPLLCTVRMSRRLFPQYRSHKLAELIARHELVAPARHRAYDDAHCLWQFYQLVLREFDLDTVEQAVRVQLESQALPSQLDRDQVEALPEGPGVYVFEDEDGSPLYVGKSVTVRRRVMSHFTSDYERGTEMKMAQSVRRLRGIPTHGELSALLLESDMVKDLQPQYNRMLRQHRMMTLVLATTDTHGYAGVKLADTLEIEPGMAPGLLAVYTTQGAARRALRDVAARYGLCQKLLGLEHSTRGCFWSQLGRCHGACTGAEAAEDYNARFAEAFERQRVAEWPYRGAVLIREQRSDLPGSTGFVIDNWCLVARLRELEDGTVESQTERRRFDLDRYRIIRAFLQDPGKRRAVQALTPDMVHQLVAENQ
jgi:DNA polymerase-3 subunit epsilon